MKSLTFGSLFSGIGGFDLGLERAGMICKWQVEIDDFCQKVLTKHWPNVPKFGDIHDVGKHNLESVDLICGGFPCQPFSNAGKRKGKEDDRYLWPEMLRVIQEIKPHWIIGENVAGFVNMELENAFTDMETEGYQVESFVLPALSIGAPHRRNRVWIVAYPDSHRQSFTELRRASYKTQGDEVFKTKPLLLPAWPDGPGKITDIPREIDGVSHRVDRVRSLGNSVVPQIPEILGRCILEIEANQ